MEYSNLNSTDLAIIDSYSKGYVFYPNGDIVNRYGKTIGSNNGGRLKLCLYMEGQNSKPIPVFSHRFIAYHLWGDRIFKEGILVRHLNDNPLDNRWENLALGTNKDNVEDARRNGVKIGRGSKSWDWNAVYWSYIRFGWADTSRKYKISPSAMSYIIKNHKPTFLQRLYTTYNG